MSLKLLPAALLLFVALAVGMGTAFNNADDAVASVNGALVPSANAMYSGGTPISITIPVGTPNGNDDVNISVTTSSGTVSGTLVVTACTPNCPGDLGKSTTVDDGVGTTVTTDGLSQIIVALGLTCSDVSSVTLTAGTVADGNQTIDIGCAPVQVSGGSGGSSGGGSVVTIPDVGQFVVSANPNILPCEGGTTTIHAQVLETLSVLPDNWEIHFRISSGAGTLNQTSGDTANLILAANQTQAVVTATLYINDGSNSTTYEVQTPTIQLACNNTNGDQTLVVTASPNVIDCTGTTTITASVRDANGHVVLGRGYHFTTSAGLLQVDPNNASTEEGVATLSLKPGDGDATITVSSGLLFGTYEEIDSVENNFVVDETSSVTVQQNCLSTTTGQILLNSSAKTVACGENVFIGLSVIDENIQTVIDNTPMTLIATAGGFYGGEGTLLTAAQVPTTHGEANTIYTAPANFNGEVKITAASGDAYGYTKLNVTCVLAPNTGTGTSAASGGTTTTTAPSCTPIGDGVCVPNAITPPNTGDAGLK